MQFKTMMSLAAVLAMTSAAMAGEEIHNRMAIAVVGDADGEVTRLNLDSEEMGFKLHDLQVGENRAFADADGRNVLVTREEDGFTFDIDGETIDVPAIGSGHGPMHWIAKGSGDVDVDVEFIHPGDHPPPFVKDGVVIISSDSIDEATQQTIRSALEAAGQDGEIRFVDRESGGDARHVEIIRKKVELKQ